MLNLAVWYERSIVSYQEDNMELQECKENSSKGFNQPPNDKTDARAQEYFEQYWQYASTLRNWYVVYGVGGIALLFTKVEAFEQVDSDKKIKTIVAFLVAVLAQVVISLFRKWVHWCIYSGKEHNRVSTWWYSLNIHISRWVWLDISCDIISLAAFSYASCLLISCL
jgi:hypothetical protein